MRTVRTLALLLLLPCGCLAQQAAQTPTPTPTPAPAQPRPSALVRFLIATGIITTPGGMKGPDEDREARRRAGLAGRIWTVNLNAALSPLGFGPLTAGGGFRSPVVLAGGAQVLALKGETIVRITIPGGSVEELETVPGILKLVRQSIADPENVVALIGVGKGDAIAVATFSTRTKQLILIPYGTNSEEETLVSNLLSWEREYEGGTVTLFDEMDEAGEGANKTRQFNVFLQPKGKAKIKLSDCVRQNCIQPSFLNGPRIVAYIKVE